MASEAVGYACLDGAIVPLSEARIPVTSTWPFGSQLEIARVSRASERLSRKVPRVTRHTAERDSRRHVVHP
jgi:hypothetical protein